ncbi:FAR1-RELATED SEQUENCE 3 [Spatholobus suberectus]|nr:FAR1-RELATED SEQUENCE 3 [Spatholobus suberectus]
MEEAGVLHELHKLSRVESEETLDRVLCTLWSTRKTGLPPSDKSHFQSLLNLPSLSQLDPVLACLRSLVRKCAHQNLARDDVAKLFPRDLPLRLQTSLLSSLQRNRDRWKEDVSLQQQVTPNVAPSVLWPRQEQDSIPSLDRTGFETATLAVPALGVPPCFQCHAVAPSDNLENLPCLKSMTWTMENRGSSPADRVAIISLKLHDYSKSPSGETEVKFRLTRDTLEAMLRSMTYISEQLNAVGTSSEPANKKQKQ